MNTQRIKVSILKAGILAFIVNGAVNADSQKLLNPDNGHLYQYVSSGLTWANAQGACLTTGGHLVTLTTAAENTWVWNRFGTIDPTKSIWLGGTDEATEGRWKWVSGEPFDYANWVPGQPDNWNDQDYMIYNPWYFPHYPGQWDDEHGDSVLPYICEWDTPKANLVSIPDINGDSRPDVAAVRYDAGLQKTVATVKNPQNGALLQKIAFDGTFALKNAVAVSDLNGNGAAEIAVLGARAGNSAVQVEIRDSRSGAKVSAVPFDSRFRPIDLQLVHDGACSAKTCLAVLQQGAEALRIEVKDALTGNAVRTIDFNSDYKGKLFTVIADSDDNQKAELAVLADHKIPCAAYKLEVRDSKTGALSGEINLPLGEPAKYLAKLGDLNQNGGDDVATVLAHERQIAVLDSKAGVTLNTLQTALSAPFFLTTATEPGSAIHPALLGQDAAGQSRAGVYDAVSGALLRSIVYAQTGTTVGFSRIPDINGNRRSELARLRVHPKPPFVVAEIRDSATGVLINTIGF